MHAGDDLYVGGFLGAGLTGITLGFTGTGNPTLNQGVGPAGRIFFHNIIPLAPSTTNLAAAQALVAGTPLTFITNGAGITYQPGGAPDGSGLNVWQFDVPRCVQINTGANLTGVTFTIVGYDQYKRKTTATLVGGSGAAVVCLKAMMWVASITPNVTTASTASAGGSNTFGLPFRAINGAYLQDIGWCVLNAATFTLDTGTFVVADQTSPATAATGDPRGTYAPSSNADGNHQLIIGMHLDGTQCGQNALLTNAIGVTPF